MQPKGSDPRHAGALFGAVFALGLFAVGDCFAAPTVTSVATLRDSKGPISNDLHEQIISIPVEIQGKTYQLESTLFRPRETGRFPLVVINHGSWGPPRQQARYRPMAACAALVHQGYAVVLPMRRGYAGSEGDAVRVRATLTEYGLENALDIKGAIGWLTKQDFVSPERIFVIGFSTGGLATMAYLTMADHGVRGAINFHGGMRPKDLENDPLLDQRVDAFATYARSTTLPSLWIYTANDHSSRPPFITRLHNAYEAAGGHAELHQLPAFKQDGHTLFDDRDGRDIWLPIVRRFMETH